MTLPELLLADPFQGYAYSYPHKTAYRQIDPAIELQPLWSGEDRSALFLYLHIPFCEVRCGFCNLFTSTGASESVVERYLATLSRQIAMMRDVLGDHQFARVAVGGGTPTFLNEKELELVFQLIRDGLGSVAGGAPFSFEMSPGTVDPRKLRMLQSHGVTRASIGVQSFLETETRSLGRPQKPEILRKALEQIRNANFAVMNIDLIYGIPGQTKESWETSLQNSLLYQPEEIYLYPLYVRPLTGLHRIGRDPSDQRFPLYLHGRDFLCSHGYEQISMRLFRARSAKNSMVNAEEGAVYCCQEDGMVGLGAGARSYTDKLHYSSEYAVGQNGIKAILENFCLKSDRDFTRADYGAPLDESERRRRFVIKSILRRDGLDGAQYRSRFGSSAFEDFPELGDLVRLELAKISGHCLVPTQAGLDRSDSIGPWLFSESNRYRMEEFSLT